jgi:nucleoside-diphosphate-sugar epimerase
LEGLAKRATPGFYIHTSGTGVLNDVATGKLGQYTTPKIYDDIENLAEIVALPETQIHQAIDQTVLRAPANVKTAIVSPPTIYGTGATARPRILQIPWLIDAILKRGAAFQVNQGLNSWDAVHVRDVAAIYLALVEAAASGGGKATWGKEGYYFAESQNYVSSNCNFH